MWLNRLNRKIRKDIKKEAVDYKTKQERKKLILLVILMLAINITYNKLSSKWQQQNISDEVSQLSVVFESIVTFFKSFFNLQ